MKRRLFYIIVIVALLLSACSNSYPSKQDTDKNNMGSAVTEETKTDVSKNKDKKSTEEVKKERVVETHNVSLENGYKSADLEISILGVEEYQSIEGESHTDTAGEGEQYVVVYLQINNKTDKEEYFNYNNLHSTYDEKEVKTTYLLNDPKNYTSIFDSVPPKTTTKGYIVYKVPEKWNKIEFTYTGWEETRGINLVFEISSDSLKEVEPFGSEYTAPYKNKDNG